MYLDYVRKCKLEEIQDSDYLIIEPIQKRKHTKREKQIDEKRMDTIWKSFVSDDQKGTGLGLAIVRNILELHEMSYGVHNLEDGVEFYFRWKK